MANVRLNVLMAFALAAAFVAVGCGDTPVNQGGTTTDDGTPDSGVPPDDDARTRQSPYLMLLTDDEPTVTFSERVAIRVQFFDGNDNPVSDAFLTFEPQQNTADTVLTSRNASTDATGVAETFIEAGVQQVDFDVRIGVFQDDSVDPVTVRVRVQPKDASDYLVRVNYGGPISLHEAEVLLFEEEVNCEDLVESPTDAPSTFTAAMQLTIRPDADGNFPERGFNAPRTLRFRHAVVRGEPRGDTPTEGRGYFVTFGCNDVLPEPEPGSTTIIDLEMHNMWPSVEGTYDVTTVIDLLSAIPDEAEGWVRATAQVFEDPGLGILKLIAITWYEVGGGEEECHLEDSVEVCRDLEYWEADNLIADFLTCIDWDEDRGRCNLVGVDDSDIFGSIVVELLDTAISAALAATGEVGATITMIADMINHLFDNLEEFTLHGELVITQEPDRAGSLGSTNHMRYNRLSLTWLGGGTSGEDVVYDFHIRDGAIVRGSAITAAVVFHPELDETYAMAVQPFDLHLNYGDVILWLVENVVFPRVFGNDVTSFDAFLDEIIDCAALADSMAGGAASFAAGAIEDACNAFTGVAVDAMEGLVRSLTADLSNFFQMGTPALNPCAMDFSQTTNRFEINTLGGSETSDRCEWHGDVRFSDADIEGEAMDGFWWGEAL